MKKELKTFEDWVQHAIDFGIECLDVSTGETIAVMDFASSGINNIIVQHRGILGPDDRRQSAGRNVIANLKEDAVRYSLIWPALIDNGEEEPVEAIIIEAGTQEGKSVIVAQRYEITDEAELKKVGGQLAIGTGRNLLKNSKSDLSSLEAGIPKHVRVKPEYDGKEMLQRLADGSINESLERMQKGNEAPFVVLCDLEQGQDQVISPQVEDENFVEGIETARKIVAEDETSHLYAVVYFGTREENGKEIDIVIAEAGNRRGDGPVFTRDFKVTKVGDLKTRKIELVEEIDNLWFDTPGDDEEEEAEDAWEDESE